MVNILSTMKMSKRRMYYRLDILKELCSTPDWNNEGNKPLSEQAVDNVRKIIDCAVAEDLDWYYLFPSVNGGLLFSTCFDSVGELMVTEDKLIYGALNKYNKDDVLSGNEDYSPEKGAEILRKMKYFFKSCEKH